MRHLTAKFILSTAIIAGGALAAQACPQSTVIKDSGTSAFLQLAQAGGGSGGAGGSAGGSGSSTSTDSGGSTGGATSPGTAPGNTTSGGGRNEWPKEQSPGAGGTAGGGSTGGTSGTGQTSPQTPK